MEDVACDTDCSTCSRTLGSDPSSGQTDSEPSEATTMSSGPRAPRWVQRSCVRFRRVVAIVMLSVLVSTQTAWAQAPWERAANNLALTFTGPLARSLALVAIVIGGLLFMFGEAGAKRQISGIVFGGGLALFAAQFLTWLF